MNFMAKIFNNKRQTLLRKILRNQSPKAEVILWQILKGKSLQGFKFRRQVSIGRYVVDFYCPEAKLVIEIDGDSHFQGKDVQEYDANRQEQIESLGLVVLRFLNTEIYESLDGVVDKISEHLRTPPLGGGAGEVGALSIDP